MEHTNGYNGTSAGTMAIIEAPANGEDPTSKRRTPYTRNVYKPVDNINDTRTPGQRLRKLLSMTGMTFDDFAELANIPGSSLSSICSDKMPLHGERLHVRARSGRLGDQ